MPNSFPIRKKPIGMSAVAFANLPAIALADYAAGRLAQMPNS